MTPRIVARNEKVGRGRPILSQHTVRPGVQAASDRNGDGRFTGIVHALGDVGRGS